MACLKETQGSLGQEVFSVIFMEISLSYTETDIEMHIKTGGNKYEIFSEKARYDAAGKWQIHNIYTHTKTQDIKKSD